MHHRCLLLGRLFLFLLQSVVRCAASKSVTERPHPEEFFPSHCSVNDVILSANKNQNVAFIP